MLERQQPEVPPFTRGADEPRSALTDRSLATMPSGSLPEIVMMQAAHQRHLGHLPTVRGLNWPRDWTVLCERSVRADFVVVFEVGFENLAQLPFLEHDHSIQAFTSNRTHQALDVGFCQGDLGEINFCWMPIPSSRCTKTDP